jgi:hypothetical protein
LERKADSLTPRDLCEMSPRGNGFRWPDTRIARPTLDYIEAIFTGFVELHGDRTVRDDAAIVGGIAYLDGRPVTVLGPQKGEGRDTKEKHSAQLRSTAPRRVSQGFTPDAPSWEVRPTGCIPHRRGRRLSWHVKPKREAKG